MPELSNTALAGADTVVVPGVADPLRDPPAEVLAALRAAADRRARIASICVGAFTLAAAGLLDERRATTHWAAAAAGLDLCLRLVRRDHGAAVARTARVSVMPLERDGGQAPFVAHEQPVAEPALPRADRHDAAAVGEPAPVAPRPAAARIHRPARGAARRPGRIHRANHVPGAVSRARRRQSPGVPAVIPVGKGSTNTIVRRR